MGVFSDGWSTEPLVGFRVKKWILLFLILFYFILYSIPVIHKKRPLCMIMCYINRLDLNIAVCYRSADLLTAPDQIRGSPGHSTLCSESKFPI